MSRILTALIAVTVIGTAAPASAFSLQLGFPTLTFPTQTSPEATQACTDLTTLAAATCSSNTK